MRALYLALSLFLSHNISPRNVGPDAAASHSARADTAHTSTHATRDRPTRARVRRRPSGGAPPHGTAQSIAQQHGTQEAA